MALIPKFSISQVENNPALLVIKDTTGVYDVTTNPGGYGTPNPDQSDLHWDYSSIIRVKDSGNSFKETTIFINDTLVSGSVGEIMIDKGGLFKAKAYGSYIYDPSNLTYQIGDILWDETGEEYVEVTALNSGVATVESINFEDVSDVEFSFIVEFSVFYSFDLEKAMGELLKDLPATSSCDMRKWMDKWNYLNRTQDAIQFLACRGFYNNALMILGEFQHDIITDDC